MPKMEIMQALLYIGFLFSFFLTFYKLIFPSSGVQLKNLSPSPPRIPILSKLSKPSVSCMNNSDRIKQWTVMLQAGLETSITTLEAAVSFLISHPNEFNKARDEIDSHVGQSRLMDEDDLSKLTYLHCIINETLRLGPTIPLNALHESSRECVVGGFGIPSGTILVVNAWALHNDPRLWGDPTLFKPERFVGVEGEKVGFKLFPFGLGRRACPGDMRLSEFGALMLGVRMQPRIVDHTSDCIGGF